MGDDYLDEKLEQYERKLKQAEHGRRALGGPHDDCVKRPDHSNVPVSHDVGDEFLRTYAALLAGLDALPYFGDDVLSGRFGDDGLPRATGRRFGSARN
jgi:hypothetical protein